MTLDDLFNNGSRSYAKEKRGLIVIFSVLLKQISAEILPPTRVRCVLLLSVFRMTNKLQIFKLFKQIRMYFNRTM